MIAESGMSRLFIPALVAAAGVAFAQTGIKVSAVNSDGTITTSTITAGASTGPGARAPLSTDGNSKYWDGIGLGGAGSNYFTQVPYVTAPPNPQIAAGPDDILTVVNRTIARYPNPNASGQVPTIANPYNNPPTEFAPLDVWMGLTVLGGNTSAAALCPSGTGSNSTCVIDNASVRYDQLQGRFIVLFTVTDLPAHRSNWVLLVSRFAQLQQCPTAPTVGGAVCQTPIFTSPVIAPIVGGTSTGGVNPANWVLYRIPINLLYNQFQQPSALGLINNPAAPFPLNSPLANSAVGTPNTVSSGGSSAIFLTTPFCPNGGPLLPLTWVSIPARNGNPATPVGAGGTGRTCTNYYPTSARFGIDNDNIILTAPVLDQAFSGNEGNFPSAPGQFQGPYAGTRVTTVAKIAVYNGTALNLSQPGPGGCTSDTPIDCQAVNLSDDTATGTLTAITQQIAFAQGVFAVPGVSPAGDLQYGAGTGGNAVPNSCATANPVEVTAGPQPAGGGAVVLSCAPVPALLNALKAIFWEPDNLRGRALASYDAQVAPFTNTAVAGVITPIDYLVGSEITNNFGGGLIPQGVPGVTSQPDLGFSSFTPTASISTIFYIQPIAFSCPATALFGSASSVVFCGSGVPGGHSLVADLPFFGPLRRNVSTLADFADPTVVGQGFSAQQQTTNPLNIPVTSTANSRLFVGDSRPQQVIFREGLLYIARAVTTSQQSQPDNFQTFLDSSTVLYDIIKTCATALPAPACGAYSITGTGLTNPALAFEYRWYYGTNVPDPDANAPGFGFYQPMFDVPADVVNSGPFSGTAGALPVLDKLFVGMTTGGSNNTLGTFSKNFPSLWDFRPGDDAFDTVLPYLDPYRGVVFNSYPCDLELIDITVSVLSKTGNAITVNDATGLGAGMFLAGTQTTIVSISGNVITLSAPFNPTTPATATFTRNRPPVSVTATLIQAGSNQVGVNSTSGLAIGQSLGFSDPASSSPAGNVSATAFTTATTLQFKVSSAANIGLGELINGGLSANVSTSTVTGGNVLNVANTSQVGVGEAVTGTGIAANTVVTAIAINSDGSLQIKLNNPATATGPTTVQFDSTPCFPPGSFVVAPSVLNGSTVATNNAVACTSFGSSGTVFNPANGAVINNGIPVVFTFNLFPTGSVFPIGTAIVNMTGSVVTLSNPAANPLPGALVSVPSFTSTGNVPLNFVTNLEDVQCSLIPFGQRGGASTDPNDGSLWLYGEFAKNRLSTIPGPGQWGTSIANYALSFPATDPYGNDNTYFQDVQPAGSPDSAFFTWIQIAKNLGLAVPSATGPCSINTGVIPVQQPPGSGSTPVAGPGTLGCPYFGPDATVTRAEMAYWVVRAQMDDQQVSNYLCATGGDPTGGSINCNGSIPAFTFADVAQGVNNPFLGAVPPLNIAGVTTAQLQRYIEVMARRGYTKGCGTNTSDPLFGYCPNAFVTRAQMAVFLVRAKMNNVFPTTLSGLPLASPYGDNFGVFTPATPYFSDVSASDPAYGPYAIYIQKMRELRITNGTSGSTFSPGNNLTRKEIATFIVRAFFL